MSKKKTVTEAVSEAKTLTLNPFDIAIMGGKDTLPENQVGPKDTVTDKAHPLYDERLKLVKIGNDNDWISNIDTNGVLQTLKGVELDGTVFVVDGRERLRGARAATRRREERKDTRGPVMVRIEVVNLTDLQMLEQMISLNLHFQEKTVTKIAKAHRLFDALGDKPEGEKYEYVATQFAVKPNTLRMWFAYDETAIKPVKDAVNKGLIPHTTGMDIARLGDEGKQTRALEAILKTAKRDPDKAPKRGGSSSKAARIIKGEANPDASPGISDKKTQKKLLYLINHVKPSDGQEQWWDGVEAAFNLILGAEKADKRLLALLKKVDSVDVTAANVDKVVEKAGKEETPSTSSPPSNKGKKAKKEAKPAADDGDDE